MEGTFAAVSIIADFELFDRYVSENMRTHLRRRFPEVEPFVLRRRIVEFLKFILIAGNVVPAGELPVSLEIDEVWHEWILETRNYESLCMDVAGRFIHHSSIDVGQPSAEQAVPDPTLERQMFFVAAYVLNFGSFDDESLGYWPAAERVMRLYGLTLAQLNSLALDMAATCAQPPHLRLKNRGRRQASV